MQKSSKTIIEIPAGGFYVYNPKKQPNVVPTSDGAFGCCYLTIKDGDNILVAHINATSIMLEPVAKETVSRMLNAFKKAGGKIEQSEIEIVHSNDPQEYELGFKNRPTNLTKDQWERRGHYSERMEDNENYPYVAEPFAHVALQKALEQAGIFSELQVNHAKEFISLSKLIKGEESPANWADICFANLDIVYDYIQKNGWNFNSSQAEIAAFLMAQHGDAGLFGFIKDGNIDGDNPKLQEIIVKQKFILDKIKKSELFKENQSTKLIAAFVEDRILRNECKEQIYGTQRLFKNTPTYSINVDDNRSDIGFKETCEEYHKRTQNDPLTYKEILDHSDKMKSYIENLESGKIMPSIIINDNFNSNLGEFMSNGNAPAIKTDIIIGSNGETYLRNVAHDFNNNTHIPVKHSENDAEEVFKQVAILSEDKINNKLFKPNWQETPPVGKFYVNVANDIKNGFISVENGIGAVKEGSKDYSQFAAMDMNKYVEEKLALSEKSVQTSFSELLEQKVEASFKQQTISSLMHQGREDKAMNHPKAKKSFVEALKERQSKEGKQSKGK